MTNELNIMNENQTIKQQDRWQKPGDIVTSPKPIWGTSTRSVMNSTRYVFKTTHVRFKNVSINYNLPVGEYLGSAISSVQLRSEEHTSELQSRGHLVCRLLLEKKKK